MKKTLLLSGLAISIMIFSCKKDEETTPTTPTTTTTGTTTSGSTTGYTVPTTYDFKNVDYSEQTKRIDMFTAINTETGKGTSGAVDATKLKNMFSNTNAPFTDAALNSSGLQIKDQTVAAVQPLIEAFIDSLALASASGTPYSNGVAGVAVSTTDATKKYLLSANGVEYRQVISKILMGAFLLHQVKNNYLSSTGIGTSVDNSTVITGKGTAMEHNWDLAFGSFGVPIAFPDSIKGLKFLGSYSNQVKVIGSNATIMNAFLKGRAAISNKDAATKDAQAIIVTSELEKVLAAGAILELKSAKTNFTDNAVRNHVMSEGMGFVLALKYLPGAKLTQTQADALLAYFGTNFNDISLINLDNIINSISTIYGLDNFKGQL